MSPRKDESPGPRGPGNIVERFLQHLVSAVGVDPHADGDFSFRFGEADDVLRGVAPGSRFLSLARRDMLRRLANLSHEFHQTLARTRHRANRIPNDILGGIVWTFGSGHQ